MDNKKLIHGVGINDLYGSVKKNKITKKAYDIWLSMLRRAYSTDFKNENLAYAEVYVCDEWLYFSNFKKWFDENYRWDLVEQGIIIELDKDLLSNGEKVYSPKTCVFLPKKVNSFIQDRRSSNSSGYTGAHWYTRIQKYEVRVREFGTSKSKYLGLFEDSKEAQSIYIKYKLIEVDKVKEWLLELGYKEEITYKIYEKINNSIRSDKNDVK